LVQALAFLLLPRVQSFGGLAFLAFVVLLCYGFARPHPPTALGRKA